MTSNNAVTTGQQDGIDDRRKFTRVDLGINAQLVCGEESSAVKVKNLSLQGALIEKPQSFARKINDPIILIVTVIDLIKPITIEMLITHIDTETVGLHCDFIDVANFSQLKNLLSSHADEPTKIDDEAKQTSK